MDYWDHCWLRNRGRQPAGRILYSFNQASCQVLDMNSILVPTIICPGCGAELGAHVEICPRCHSPVQTVPGGGAPRPLSSQAAPTPALDKPWVLVILVLHVGFLGIPLYWKTHHSVRTRLMICLASVLYTVFAVGAIGLIGGWLIRQFRGG